jgi:hypothetical protein
MDQIIKSLNQSLGLPEPAVRAGVGIILNFVKQKSAASDNAQFTALLGLLPGASELMASAPAIGESSGGGVGDLRAKGVAGEDAVNAVPKNLPALASMFTGE